MNSPAQSRITRWITTCIQPTDSGELEKEAEDDAEAARKTADRAPGLEATLDQDMWARDHGHTYDAVELPTWRKPAGDAQERLLGAMHIDVRLFAQIRDDLIARVLPRRLHLIFTSIGF
jgi:hypothetical protein